MKEFGIGVVLGLSNIIPGVSGGTMAVAFGIYGRLIRLISDFGTQIKKDWFFLVKLLAGALAGILLFSRLMVFLLSSYPVAVGYFFTGVIIGSLPPIGRKALKASKGPAVIISFFLPLLAMAAMALGPVQDDATVYITRLTAVSFLQMLFCGVVASGCMLVPGVSGSFMMVLLKAYPSIMAALAGLNLPVLLPFGLGLILGLLLCARLIRWVMERYAPCAYAGILGFMLGSILSIWPGPGGLLPWAALAAGVVLIGLFNRFSQQYP